VKTLIALLVLLIALLQYRLWFGDGNLREFQRLQDRIDELKQEGQKRKDRNAALEAEVVDLKQGLDAIEERARQDLGMIKEGETFVQVIDAKHPVSIVKSAPSAPESTSQDVKPSEAPPRRRRIRREKPAELPDTIEEAAPEEPVDPLEQ
jgi:cell division protein FtsB